MKKIKFIIALLIPFGIYAQSQRYYFIEAGTDFNAKTHKEFHIKDPGGATTRFEYKGAIQSLPSYYVKAGLEKSYGMCSVSRVSFPISLSYFNEAQNIKAIGGWSGCTGAEGGNYNIMRNNHFAVFSLGIKVSRTITNKISLQNGFNFSQNLLVCEENNFNVTNEAGTTNYYFTRCLGESNISFSTQSGVFYQMNPNTRIGFTAEYFFYSKLVQPRNKEYLARDIYNFKQGYKGYSAMVNVGLRLQHSF